MVGVLKPRPAQSIHPARHALKNIETKMIIFSSPFNAEIDRAPEELQMKIIVLQSCSELKDKFIHMPLM